MKNFFKISSFFILTLALSLSFLTTAFAYEYGEVDIESMVVTEKVGEKTNYYISGNDINRIRISKSRSMKSKSNYEKLYDVFTSIDGDISEKYKEFICSSLDLNIIEGIRIGEEFLEIDENGNEKIINEEYALSKSKTVNKAQQNDLFSSTEWHTSTPEDFKSGLITYMQQQIIAVYTPHYNGNKTTPGRYVFFGISQWLTNPVNRKKDCVTLSSDDFTWSAKSSGDYSGYLVYDVDLYTNGELVNSYQEVEEVSDSNITVLATTGVYFVFNMPFKIPLIPSDSMRVTNNIGFISMGVANTTFKPELLNEIGVHLIYSHTKTSISTSINFGWSSENGVSFGVAVSGVPTHKEFPHSFPWSMADDYNKYIKS